MRRILLVLSVAALMAAMVLAMAVPAFADPEGEPGHATQSGDVGFVNCDPFVQSCTGEQTFAGKNAVPGGGGRFETDSTIDFSDPSHTVIDVSGSSQGGGPGIGGVTAPLTLASIQG